MGKQQLVAQQTVHCHFKPIYASGGPAPQTSTSGRGREPRYQRCNCIRTEAFANKLARGRLAHKLARGNCQPTAHSIKHIILVKPSIDQNIPMACCVFCMITWWAVRVGTTTHLRLSETHPTFEDAVGLWDSFSMLNASFVLLPLRLATGLRPTRFPK